MDDTEYLAARAQQELSAALRSSDRRVRNVHVDFADAYVLRLREAQAKRRRAEMRLVTRVADDQARFFSDRLESPLPQV